MFLGKLRRIIWEYQREPAKIALSIIIKIPGVLGNKIRQKWWKSKVKRCGKKNIFEKNVRIQNAENCILGDNIHFKYDCYLNASGSLVIGNDVVVGERTKIWTDNHLFLKTHEPFTLQGFEYKEVVIGDQTKIGAGCFIKPGVMIGKGCTLLAGSVLSKSIPDGCVVAGNPAIIIERKE